MFIDEKAAPFFADAVQCEFELRAAIAAKAVEHVARETLRVDADERRWPGNVAEAQDDGFFYTRRVVSFEAEDAEVSESAGEIGFCNFK
jgi:hypothetical protein